MRCPALLLAAALLLGAGAVEAELYRCQGADGKTLFTSDRSQCPGASAHRPDAAIQRTQPSGPARAPSQLRPARTARPAAPLEDDATEASAWQAKRTQA